MATAKPLRAHPGLRSFARAALGFGAGLVFANAAPRRAKPPLTPKPRNAKRNEQRKDTKATRAKGQALWNPFRSR
jgi:hypothetical protein